MGRRFREVETLINLRIAKASLVIVEVPDFERSRLHGASNLNAISDGMRVLREIRTEREKEGTSFDDTQPEVKGASPMGSEPQNSVAASADTNGDPWPRRIDRAAGSLDSEGAQIGD